MNTRADLVEHASGIHARYVRRWIGLEHASPRSVAREGVGRIDRGGVDTDAHFTRPRLRVGQFYDAQRLRPTELDYTHRSHGLLPVEPAHCGVSPRGRGTSN